MREFHGASPDRDRTPEEGPQIGDAAPLVAILDNLRSAFNVGSIFRTAEAAALEHLHLCGITPYPPNEKLDRTALGTSHRVPWTHHLDTLEAVRMIQQSGRQVLALEVSRDASCLQETELSQPLGLVFGHEVAGIDPRVLQAVDGVVAIPMFGRKNSLNVATTFGIAVFEVLRQWGLTSRAVSNSHQSET